MEDYLLKAKKISRKYGENILNLLYERPGLFHSEICEVLSLLAPNLTTILNKLIQENLIEEKCKGKYKYYFLSEKVKSNIEQLKTAEEKQERSQDVLYKTLFSNIISGLPNNVYVSYLSKDIAFTFAYFSGAELMMLLFILGIYSYGEGQNFASVFGVNELLAVETEKNLLTKFQTFLFEVIQKYNIPIDNRENGNALK